MQNVRKPNWPTPAYAMKVLGAYALVALAAGVVAMAILAISRWRSQNLSYFPC
jgi:hypothetical protein